MKKSTNLSETSVTLIRAVRAEAARAGISTPDLAERIGRDRKFLYDRFALKTPFSTEDLADIAKALGITAEDIIKSASLEAQRQKQEVAA